MTNNVMENERNLGEKMDLSIDLGEYKLNIRAAVIIIHNNKVLLHRNKNSDHYALLGGRVELGECSEETVKRELLEETGKEIEVTGYISTVENFFEIKGKKYHEIMFVHQGEFINFNDRELENNIKNVEGKDHLVYEWIDIKQLEKINLKPNIIVEVLLKGKYPVHKIYNELR